MSGAAKDIDPASDLREEDEEQALPEFESEEEPTGTLKAGVNVLLRDINSNSQTFMSGRFTFGTLPGVFS